MAISLKNKGRAITANAIVAVIFLLHFIVYFDNFGYNIPLLHSYTDPPLAIKQLSLCEEMYPSYFNPFRKVQYTYQVHSITGDPDGECNLSEKAESVFTSKMIANNWTPEDYWEGYDNEGFLRPLAGGEYANIIFFLAQYGLVATFIFVILKPEESK